MRQDEQNSLRNEVEINPLIPITTTHIECPSRNPARIP